MKKLFFLVFGALCLLIASCSKDSGFYPGSDPSLALSKGYPAHGPVVVVPPNKDGDDDGDTDDLMAAINSAEPGTVIKLTEGTYEVGLIELFGFEGQIVGSGRDKTIIYPAGLIAVRPQSDDRNLLPCWWRIIGGDVIISDLTFKTGDGILISDVDLYYNRVLASLLVINNYDEDFQKENPKFMNFTIRNVNFVGGKLDPADGYLGADFNVLMPLWIGMAYWWPPVDGIVLTKGNYKVVNCYFEHCYQGPEFFSLGEDAIGTIDRIKVNNCGYGLACLANYNTRINITNSSFTNSLTQDIWIDDADWGLITNITPFKRCQYTLSDNVFNSLPGVLSLVVNDSWGLTKPDIYQPSLSIIKNNLFRLSDGGTGISITNNIDGIIRNNRFIGTGSVGVYVDGAAVPDPVTFELLGPGVAKNALILGNNFTGLNPATADIVLGENSMDCTVVGIGKESVIDNGTNNAVVGMKRKTGGNHSGPTIRDNFRMWHGRRHNK